MKPKQDPQNKPLIDYIPIFLNYCKKEKRLSKKTIETYEISLKKFLNWLKNSFYFNISPKNFSEKIIEEYKSFLKNQNITINTQNHYLITLRALFSYLVFKKNLSSLYPEKIKLYKFKKSSSDNYLDEDQIKKLLDSPKTSTITGLRDKAILEFLLSTGLKLEKLTSLNRETLSQNDNNYKKRAEFKIPDKKAPYFISVCLSEETNTWLNKYLNSRTDSSKALFIRYKGPKNSPVRLTGRSVENVVKKYTKKAELPSSITPETLRNIYAFSVLNNFNNIKIKNISAHESLNIKNYKLTLNKNSFLKDKITKNINLNWRFVEDNITKELKWLENNILFLPERYKSENPLSLCNSCLLRKLSILIVSGKIRATELKGQKNNDLWNNLTKEKNIQKLSEHGKDWHKKMINIVHHYFTSQNYKLVVIEPVLNYGRADLGVFSDFSKPIYIEIGTVSLYKLWYNFLTMKNTKFLLVFSEEYAIEFETYGE